jgi:hypothetical protein
MNDGVRFERVIERPHRPMHHVLVQRPLEKRGENNRRDKSNRGPKE